MVDVKIRSNLDRVDGGEDVPDGYFEDGTMFLPEEIETGRCISDRGQRKLFREFHDDPLITHYRETLQRELVQNQAPSNKTYPDSCRLQRA